METPIDLRVTELLMARLCHDLIGPVAAVANGAELLADEDAEFAREAIALVGDSARTSNRRLQFYRFAYAYTGGGIAGSPPHQLAAEFFEGSPISCDYAEAARAQALDWQKLACNMLLIAAEPLSRGGRLELRSAELVPEIHALGQGNGVSPQTRAAMTLETPVADLTSRTVGAYFAGLLARRLGWRIVANEIAGGFRLSAAPAESG
jgi:histidine phosphotransferase ChpT